MEDILDYKEETPQLSDKEVFTKIWTSPRLVFRYINDTQYDKYVMILLVLSGVSRAFDQASVKNMGDHMGLIGILSFGIIGGALLGWISYYIYAALLSWTGSWLKGRGNTTSIIRILAYSMLPSIVALLFLIPQIAIYGLEIFKSDGDITSAFLASNILVYLSMFLELVLGIWTIVLAVVGISEVQKLSIGKAILNLLLPVLVILVPILMLVMLFKI